MILTARQSQEKCIEQNETLYRVLIDLKKGFDTINSKALWTVLEGIRSPHKFERWSKSFIKVWLARSPTVVMWQQLLEYSVVWSWAVSQCQFSLTSHVCRLMQSRVWRKWCISYNIWLVASLTFALLNCSKKKSLSSSKPPLLTTIHLWLMRTVTHNWCLITF